MSPVGGPAFWSSGGEILATGGRVLAAGEAEALVALYGGLDAPDPRARDYLERRRAELELALAHAGRWRRAASPVAA